MKVARQVWYYLPKKSKSGQIIYKLWSVGLGGRYIYHFNKFINKRIQWHCNKL